MLYRGLEILIHPVNKRFKPIFTNWRGTEPIKTDRTFESPEAAIAFAKEQINDYYNFESLRG